MAAIQINGNGAETYLDLIREMPLRSIVNDRQLAAAQKMVDRLSARHLATGEEDYLDALTDLIETYESDAFDFGDATCAQVLTFLIEDRGLTQRKVAEGSGISKSTISELVHGKRTVTVELAKKLGVYFAVPPSIFIAWE